MFISSWRTTSNRIAYIICTISIFALLLILFLMLITAKKLLPSLIKEKHSTIHSFLSKSDFAENRNIQRSIKSYSHSSEESHRSFSISVSQPRSQQSDINS